MESVDQIQSRINIHSIKRASGIGMKVAGAAFAAIGIFEVWDHFPGLPHYDLFEHSPPAGAAAMHPDTYVAQEVDIHCSDEVTADAGVTASSSYTPVLNLSLGSIVENKLMPVRWLECGDGGISTVANVTYVEGKATTVTVPLKNYHPTAAGVDDLNPIMCLPLQANATNSEVRQALAKYELDAENGHPDTCNMEDRATGGIATGGTAGQTDELSRQLALIAGNIEPLPVNVQKKVLANARQQVINYEHAQFPGANVVVEMPSPESDLQQTLNGWNGIRNEVNSDFHNIRFSAESGGRTVLSLSSTAAKGQVIIHEKSTVKEIKELNKDA